MAHESDKRWPRWLRAGLIVALVVVVLALLEPFVFRKPVPWVEHVKKSLGPDIKP